MSIHITGTVTLAITLSALFQYPAYYTYNNIRTNSCFSIKQYDAAFTNSIITDHAVENEYNKEIQDELKDFIILSFLSDHIAEAIIDYYGSFRPYMNETIMYIEKLGGEYRIRVKLETFTGAHNPPYGIDSMTVIKNFMGVRVEDYEHDEVPPWSPYLNEKYHVSLKYPAYWTKDHRYAERYNGPDGYFFIVPVVGGAYLKPDHIEEVVKNVLCHKIQIYGITDFGSDSKAESLKIRGQDARLITAGFSNQAILVIKYPGPIEVDERIYNYFILAADAEHIKKIVKTIRFIY